MSTVSENRWASSALEPVLYKVHPRDAGVFVGVVVLLGVVALLASFLPARRVAKLRHHHTEPQQSRDVRKIMIAGGDVREFEIAPDVVAVLLK